MKQITSHKVNGLNEALEIKVLDEPGQGGANHRYDIWWKRGNGELTGLEIIFQHGPIQEVDINGISNEALLAIVEDRLLGFQSGDFACQENALALTKLQEAMMWLHKRTRDRIARGVEGTNEK